MIGLLLWLVVGAQADAPLKGDRLTWAPYGFLEKGLRTAPWVKDPFYPESNVFKVSGIIAHEMAFINGRWYRPGEQLDGFRVREITASTVTLTRLSQILILKMEN